MWVTLRTSLSSTRRSLIDLFSLIVSNLCCLTKFVFTKLCADALVFVKNESLTISMRIYIWATKFNYLSFVRESFDSWSIEDKCIVTSETSLFRFSLFSSASSNFWIRLRNWDSASLWLRLLSKTKRFSTARSTSLSSRNRWCLIVRTQLRCLLLLRRRNRNSKQRFWEFVRFLLVWSKTCSCKMHWFVLIYDQTCRIYSKD